MYRKGFFPGACRSEKGSSSEGGRVPALCMRSKRRLGPGEGLLNLSALAALGLWVLNDHVLKGRAPGILTGKLSDVAGMVVFPLFLQACVEFTLSAAGRFRGPSNHVLFGSVVATGWVFALIQLSPAADEVYRWSLGFLQWLPRSLLGAGVDAIIPVRSWPDRSDLGALVALGWAYSAGRTYDSGTAP